jgi:acetolactate synthase-1/2/3 large subunit
MESPSQLARHVPLAGAAAGDLTAALDGLTAIWGQQPHRADWRPWLERLQASARLAQTRDEVLLTSDADPVHPARIYGELVPRLAEDAVVIGDGGDFVSFAGRFVEPGRPGNWLDPGPFGALGTGPGYALAAHLARPASQVVLLLGDGAAGLSLMDVDTLVRHRVPVVMVVGNNGEWGLERERMQSLYGYDVAARLRPRTRYDEVVRGLGGAGELLTRPGDIGAAMDRAFAAGVPYLLNVITDPAAAYPRSTTGI